MADKKISALTASTTPLAGTEVLPIVQGGVTKQVSVANLTAGRTVAASRVDTNNTASGGVMATFTSGWSNTLVTLKGDGATGAGVMNISNAAASASLPYQLQLNGTKVFGSDINGNIDVSVGNLVIGTAGKGIDFSADPSAAGMTSELLDDYEEGTFTATLTGATPPTTPVTTTSYYTKIGDTVTVYCPFRNVDNTGAAGAISVTGLPFTSNSSVYAVGQAWVSRSTITNGLSANLNPSSTTITLIDFVGNPVSWATAGAGVFAGFEITYKV